MQDDFYADLLIEDLQKVVSFVKSVIFWLAVSIFLVVFFGLFFRPEAMNDYLHEVENYLASTFSFQDIPIPLIFIIPLLVLQGLSLLISGVGLARKYYFFPKNSFTNVALVPVHSKEMVMGRRNTRLYYVTVPHPFNQKNIRFMINQQSFEQMEKGDSVPVHWHPTQSNILYLPSKQMPHESQDPFAI